MNQRVEIQRATTSMDAYGQESKTFATLLTVWADVRVQDETENESSGKIDPRSRYRVKLRYTDINKADRLFWSGKTLEIISVSDPDNRRQHLHIMAQTDE